MAYIQDVLTGVQIQPSADGLETFIHLSQGENGRKLFIKILGIDEIPGGSVATISGTKPDGNVYSAAGTIDDITIVFNEDVQMTVVAGIWDANVRIVNGGNVIASAKLRFVIHESAVAPGAVPSDSQLDGILTECQMYAETARSAAYGSPLTASAAADMIDTSKVYVYTGDETGYTAGHWYYYDGSAWADGGVYNSIAIQTDTTLTLPDHAADAKATGDKLATKADKIGSIPVAEALRGGTYTPNAEPYHFRKSPSGGAKDEVIVGGSLGRNQLCNASSVTVQSGHKYFMNKGGTESIGASDGTTLTGLTSGTDTVIDLTTLFGSTIADYIYSLETATAGAGVAFVKRYIDLDTPHPYDAGSIQSVEGLVSHDVVGFNQWDEEWEVGGINDSTGNNSVTSNQIRSKNYIPLVPNATYYAYVGSNVAIRMFFYDTDKNFIEYVNGGNAIITIPTNARFMRFRTYQAYGTIYNHDICINLSDPSRNGQYEPYDPHSYPLDSSLTLRGVPKLVTDHIEFDGDKYRADGTLERRYGIVDLGTLNWSRSGDSPTDGNLFVTSNLLSSNGNTNYICAKYTNSHITSPRNIPNNSCGNSSANKALYIRDDTYTDAASFKTAMSGVYLVYELATPTTEQAQPYQSPMLVGQTEEYVSESVVPVGHDSRYYEDITGKVNNLPSDFSTLIAPVEKTFTATRNYTAGSYLIVNNQLYKVTSAISTGGTITPNSNVTATTIMAEIMALA